MPKIKSMMTYRGAVAAFGQRAINTVLREAMFKAGEYWGRHFREKHFTRAASREYGYEPRKGERARPGSKRFKSIAGPAELRAGEILPLVYSGETKQLASFWKVQATATSKRIFVDITLPMARGLNRLPAKYRQDPFRITDAEFEVLVKLINREVVEGLRALNAQRTVRIG